MEWWSVRAQIKWETAWLHSRYANGDMKVANQDYFITAVQQQQPSALWRSGYRARLEILFLRERRFESCQRRIFWPFFLLLIFARLSR